MDNSQKPPVPTPSATPTPGTGAPQPPRRNVGLIVGIIVAVVLVIGGIVAAVVVATNSTKSSNETSSDERTDDDSKDDIKTVNAKTASSISQFSAVCENGSISNAADFAEPYRVVAFSQPSTKKTWASVSLKYNADYKVDAEAFTEGNTVACLEEKDDTAVKSQTCEFTTRGEKVSVDYYAVEYNLTVYEAKTGKKIKDLGTINGPALKCPSFVTYSRDDPKIHANPDADAVDTAIANFVAEQ